MIGIRPLLAGCSKGHKILLVFGPTHSPFDFVEKLIEIKGCIDDNLKTVVLFYFSLFNILKNLSSASATDSASQQPLLLMTNRTDQHLLGRLLFLQELERLNQVLEEEKMKFEEVVLELKAEQEHIRL